jgi:uncharacterized RDD family membrane protein YckC
MSGSLLWSLALTAVIFGVVYYPAFDKLARGLATHYAKADVGKRFSAAIVDVLLVATTWFFYRHYGSTLWIFAGLLYVLLRDSLGRSVGKFCFGLLVVDLETGRPCSRAGSLKRNALFLVPGANFVALFLEARSIVRDPQGQRLGDRLAQTQVVEGFGVRDLAADFVCWWSDFIGNLDGTPRKPRRTPARREAA